MESHYIKKVKLQAKQIINQAYQKEEIESKIINICKLQKQTYSYNKDFNSPTLFFAFFYKGNEYGKFIHFLIDDLENINVICDSISFNEYGGFFVCSCRYIDVNIFFYIYPDKENCKITKVEVTESKYILEC